MCAALISNFDSHGEKITEDDLQEPQSVKKAIDLFAPHQQCNLESSEDKILDYIHQVTEFLNPDKISYENLLKDMEHKLSIGNGEIIYEIECQCNDQNYYEMEPAIITLKKITSSIECELVELRRRVVNNCQVTEFLIRKISSREDFLEIRVAVIGNVDAGKSTLLGVLTHGELDNGRGYSRQKLFRHKHEAESGRTSSVGNDILGFDGAGNIINKTNFHGGGLDWKRICEQSSKVVTFIDLAGHEKYLKTTVFGMTGHSPHFCMLMVGSNAGIIGMTKEHLGLALALCVPVFVVVTKIDMCPTHILQNTLKLLQKILKSPGCRKIPVIVNNRDDVITSAKNFKSERICPIFQISNVTGHNLEYLKDFLNLLSIQNESNEESPAEFQIDDTYTVPGVGTVVSGTTISGMIRLNDTLLLGPFSSGEFQPVAVRSIHRKRLPVTFVKGGQTASFALKKIKRSSIRKGMFMVSTQLRPEACWEFTGEIIILHHPTTISTKYQAMVHCGSIRQTATIIEMSKECLRTGDKALIKFRFIKHPEYIHVGTKMVFREGRTKAVGTIIKIIPHVPVNNQIPKQKFQSRTKHTYANTDMIRSQINFNSKQETSILTEWKLV